jgi:thymidine kinase
MDKTLFPNGYLELGIGCMFSGKTSWLLETYKKFTYCKTSVIVINHSEDTRYHESMLSTHDKQMIPCMQLSTFDGLMNSIDSDILDKIMSVDIVLINEGQFFGSLMPFVRCLLENCKIVYVCGLDGDFKQERFGEILDLIPICDKVHKFRALCADCKNGTHAIFSHRINSDTQQKVIGSDNYIPLCRKCLHGRNNVL